MKIPDDLLCLFSGQVDEARGSYVIEVPERELKAGEVQSGEMYRVAVLAADPTAAAERGPEQAQGVQPPDSRDQNSQSEPEPPVAEGDQRTVDIEAIGEQGDGIARVERGYVIIIPNMEMGDRVTIEITDVKANVGFGDVVEHQDYYE